LKDAQLPTEGKIRYIQPEKWIEFGNPIDEVLASETTKGCNYIKKGINMINIFY
jgi:hypothetical protein